MLTNSKYLFGVVYKNTHFDQIWAIFGPTGCAKVEKDKNLQLCYFAILPTFGDFINNWGTFAETCGGSHDSR